MSFLVSVVCCVTTVSLAGRLSSAVAPLVTAKGLCHKEALLWKDAVERGRLSSSDAIAEFDCKCTWGG